MNYKNGDRFFSNEENYNGSYTNASYAYPIAPNQNRMTQVDPPYPLVNADGFSNPIFDESLGYHHPLTPQPNEPTTPSFSQLALPTVPQNGSGKKYESKHMLMNRVGESSSTETTVLPQSSTRDVGIGGSNDKIFLDESHKIRFNDGKRLIDFVLAYEPLDSDELRRIQRQTRRETFENNLLTIGLELETEGLDKSADGKTCYTKVYIPWDALCKGAEEMKIKMPIKQHFKGEVFTLNETVYERCTASWMALGVRRKTIKLNKSDIHILKENEATDVDLFEKFKDKMCCLNVCRDNELEIPSEVNCYTAAFRRDRLDRFLLPENKEDFFSNAQRSRVVHRILMKCRYDDKKLQQMGINRLISNGTYTSAYPLHEGPAKSEHDLTSYALNNERQILYYHWARFGVWHKAQPLDLIRKYFGDKIGLYFTWIGFYTSMLIPAAIMGVCVILYGLISMSSYEPILDLCERNINLPMCPKCDKKCDYYPLTDSCLYTKATYIIDNPFTMAFAVFMSFWATFFLEFWKRKEAEVKYDWDLMNFEDEEEQPRPEFEATVTTLRLNPVTKLEEPYISNRSVCPRYTVAVNLILLMIVLVILAILSVVVYRIAVYTVIAAMGKVDITWVGLIASSTAAILNLIVIMLLNLLYEKLAYTLTEWEMPKTQTMFDDLFTFKMYLFQFVNFYGSLFYIAFFKLDPGTPKQYNRIFGFRREECNPAGCMFELGLQLFVIMVGKQVFNNFIELILPKVRKWFRMLDNTREAKEDWSQWEKDYDLVERSPQGLFYEYLEMVIQYGFITIFVAAFPLGPLFALLNNLTEIRVDAYKLTRIYRRPLGERTGDIGIWFEILSGIAKISVVVNAFTIGFVSELIPRLYYEIMKSPDHSLAGFLNSTLSCFDINDFESQTKSDMPFSLGNNSCGFGKQMCRYRGYYLPPYELLNGTIVRHHHAYEFAPEHWHLIAAKLFFVVCFEHFIFAITNFLAWVIPDTPAKLATLIKRENYLAKQAMHDEKTDDTTFPYIFKNDENSEFVSS